MIKVITAITAFLSFCLLIVLTNITTPVTAGPFGILTIFGLSYILLVVIFAYVLYYVSLSISRMSLALISRKPFEQISLKRSYYYSTVIAAAPVMLIGLQSVGYVSLYELLLVSTFVVIGCLYVSKKVK